MKFEETMRRLEEVVGRLEQGDEDLDGMMRLFEEGTLLVRECAARLTEAEARFEELTKEAETRYTEPTKENEDDR